MSDYDVGYNAGSVDTEMDLEREIQSLQAKLEQTERERDRYKKAFKSNLAGQQYARRHNENWQRIAEEARAKLAEVEEERDSSIVQVCKVSAAIEEDLERAERENEILREQNIVMNKTCVEAEQKLVRAMKLLSSADKVISMALERMDISYSDESDTRRITFMDLNDVRNARAEILKELEE